MIEVKAEAQSSTERNRNGKVRFDVVVVGAGPAGTACAYLLAKAGVRVALIERGPYPGSKNTFGGVLYAQPTATIIPEFWEEAPIERKVIEKQLWLLSEDSALKVGHRSNKFGEVPYNSFTVLRAKFDRWFAQKACEAGAKLIAATNVEDVIRDDRGCVVGVRTDRDQGDVYADVVVAADGVNAGLSRKMGLRDELRPESVALGVKEIIYLGEERIRERFNLEGDQGTDIEFLGHVTRGMVGGGFLYTNRDTVSVGVAVSTADYSRSGHIPAKLLDDLKKHPTLKPLIEGGQTKEYQAHLIPEGGYDSVPQLYADGYMVVGDAAMLVNSTNFEGSNHAMISGKLAAETILTARANHDFTASTLASYYEALRDSVTMRDLKGLRGFPKLLHSHPHFFSLYPAMLNDAAHEFLMVDGASKKDKIRAIMRQVTAKRSRWNLARDLWHIWRSIGIWP